VAISPGGHLAWWACRKVRILRGFSCKSEIATGGEKVAISLDPIGNQGHSWFIISAALALTIGEQPIVAVVAPDCIAWGVSCNDARTSQQP
jgi:hypothetical protein